MAVDCDEIGRDAMDHACVCITCAIKVYLASLHLMGSYDRGETEKESADT